MVEALDVDSPVRVGCEQGLGNDVRIVEIVIGPQRIVRLVVVDITGHVRWCELRLYAEAKKGGNLRHVLIRKSRVQRRGLEVIVSVVVRCVSLALMHVCEVFVVVGAVLWRQQGIRETDIDHARRGDDLDRNGEVRRLCRDGPGMAITAECGSPDDDGAAEEDEVDHFAEASSSDQGDGEPRQTTGRRR